MYVTVRHNSKKKIESLCKGVTQYIIYSLSSDFVGVKVETDDMLAFVQKELNDMHRTRFSYNKESGVSCLHVHPNLWFEWTNKIDW